VQHAIVHTIPLWSIGTQSRIIIIWAWAGVVLVCPKDRESWYYAVKLHLCQLWLMLPQTRLTTTGIP